MATRGHVCGSTSGADEGREEFCMHRELRDGVLSLTVCQAGQRGGPSFVGKSGHVRMVESRAELDGQGARLEEKNMMNAVSAV